MTGGDRWKSFKTIAFSLSWAFCYPPSTHLTWALDAGIAVAGIKHFVWLQSHWGHEYKHEGAQFLGDVVSPKMLEQVQPSPQHQRSLCIHSEIKQISSAAGLELLGQSSLLYDLLQCNSTDTYRTAASLFLMLTTVRHVLQHGWASREKFSLHGHPGSPVVEASKQRTFGLKKKKTC